MADSTPSLDKELPELDKDDMALTAMFEPQPPPDAEPSALQAPERVRFAMPAVLSFDGYEETFEVVILNLSTQGVACNGPQGLAVRDRLRLSFRLSLAAEPRSFPCEVMWVHNGPEQKSTYGLRFDELAEPLASEVEQAVRERAEGRAGEWPLPLMPPTPAAAPTEAVNKTRWSTVAASSVAGLCVGIAVTLLVTLWIGDPEPAATLSSARPVAEAPEMAPGAGDAPAMDMSAPQGSATPPPPDAVALVAPAPPALTESPPPAPVQPRVAKPTPKPASAKPVSGVRLRKIGLLRVEEAADKVALTLLANGEVGRHDVFWLQNPPRVVVDIANRQSGFQSKLFEVGHPLVTRLRVGQHPGKVRFVIETGKDVAPKVVSEAHGNGVRVEVRRR